MLSSGLKNLALLSNENPTHFFSSGFDIFLFPMILAFDVLCSYFDKICLKNISIIAKFIDYYNINRLKLKNL